MIHRITIISLFLVACGDGNVTTIDPIEVSTPSRDVAAGQDTASADRDAGEDASTPTRLGSSSGSRLKVRDRVLTGEDGTVLRANTWIPFDSRFLTDSVFQRASDGKTRCLPFNNLASLVQDQFTDSSCSVPLKVLSHLRCNESTRFAHEYIPGPPGDACAVGGLGVLEVGSEILAPFYKLQGTQCVAVIPLDGYVYRNVLRKVPPSDFVAAEETLEEVDP